MTEPSLLCWRCPSCGTETHALPYVRRVVCCHPHEMTRAPEKDKFPTQMESDKE